MELLATVVGVAIWPPYICKFKMAVCHSCGKAGADLGGGGGGGGGE